MDGLLVLVALVVLAIPITLIALVIGQSRLRSRADRAERELTELRQQIEALRGGGPSVPVVDAATDTQRSSAQPNPPKQMQASDARPQIQKTPPPITPPAPPSPLTQAMRDLGPWLQQNWFYAVSAASLALAGIFLVQYGMEAGLLPPAARVVAALAFGAGLIGVGEFIRRRFGDGAQSATAYLPSVFSGAGIVTLFGAILSARMLYDLIGGGAAMGGMVTVALIAVMLGWMHGPLLVAVGVIGAYGAPVVLGSSNTDASPLFGYFAIVAALGLGVDTIRRWGWISALTLALAYLMGTALVIGAVRATAWTGQIYFAVLPLMAILIPSRSLVPDHAGPPALMGAVGRLTLGARARGVNWPSFPTIMAFASVALSCAILLIMWKPGAVEIWLSVGVLAGLSCVLIWWSHRAPALQDAALLPALTLLLSVFAQADYRRVTYRTFRDTYLNAPEAGFPWIITVLVALGAGLSVLAAWRSLRGGQFAIIWAVVAAVFAPAMAIVLELGWKPATVIGSYPWALHAAALAALMALLAERFARHDGDARLRVSFAVMSALACMAYAFVILFSAVALTVALAVTVVAAAALDRVWRLPPMGYFIAAGVVTLGYRLVVDPGLSYAAVGPLTGVLVAYVGTLAALIVSLWLLRPLSRPMAQIMLDSAAWSTAGLTVSILLLRWIEREIGAGYTDTHWSFGLNAAIWLGLALAQVQRTRGRTSGLLDKVRWGLAGVFTLLGGGALLAALTQANPVLAGGAVHEVTGPILINTLAAAYLIPAVVLLGGAWRLSDTRPRLRQGLGATGGALVAFWAFTVIRHFWQGGKLMELSYSISQPEQYSYTVALLFVGAGLFYQSLARRSAGMRRAGLIVIGLAVAKVFLIDITDLDGLTRVFSLLLLGLALAALAWLNRWAQARYGAPQPATSPPPLPPQPGHAARD